MTLREADRLKPKRIENAAVEALVTLARKEIPAEFMGRLRRENASPSLFGISEKEGARPTGIHADIVACTFNDGGDKKPALLALQQGLLRTVRSGCREVEALMLAERSPEASKVSQSFRDAFQGAIEPAARLLLDGARLDRPARKLDMNEDLRAPGPSQ